MTSSQAVTVPSASGSQMAGSLDLPDGPVQAYGLYAHCFTCNHKVPAAHRICRELAAQGVAMLRVSFPGLGESEGDFTDTTFSSNVADLVSAYHWLEKNYQAPQLLVGHSLGGAVALKASLEMPRLKAVATACAPFQPEHAQHHFSDVLPELERNGKALATMGGREMEVGYALYEDLMAQDSTTYLPKIRQPLLIMHSPTDQTVGMDNAEQIFLKARYPKSLLSLNNSDHMLINKGAAQQVGKITYAWAQQYFVDESE